MRLSSIFLSFAFLWLVVSCGALNNRDITATIVSNPPGASIYVDGSYEGMAPLQLKYIVNDSKQSFFTIGRVDARWQSGTSASKDTRLATNNSYPKIILNRPTGAAGLDDDLAYARKREENLAEAELRKEIAREYAREANKQKRAQNQINMGLEMMRTGKLPTVGSNSQSNTKNQPVYRSAVTVGGADICPLNVSLGNYSHSTRKGMNKICYYK